MKGFAHALGALLFPTFVVIEKFMHLRAGLGVLCALLSLHMISSLIKRMSVPTIKGTWRQASRITTEQVAHDSYKRKVAIVISYVGSNYYGIQFQKNSAVPTVEGELRRALYEIGAVLPTNDFDRIDWSRSSRTDKGVHAGRLVVSAKLEILPAWLPQFNVPPEKMYERHTEYLASDMVRIKGLVTALNSKLPEDIRAVSCVKVNKGFTARDACSWREYEYVIPAEILTHPVTIPPAAATATATAATAAPTPERYFGHDPSTQDTRQALDRLNAALTQFLGTQNFHNFNNLRRKDLEEIMDGSYSRKRNKKASNRANRDAFLDPEASGDEEDDEEEEQRGEMGMVVDGVASLSMQNTADATITTATTIGTVAEGVGVEGASLLSNKENKENSEPWVNYNDLWTPEVRPIVQKFRIKIYHVKARLLKSRDGRDMVAIEVRGSGFLLNQIRLMIGAALLTARGVIPPETISAALLLPFRYSFPMVPAEGLYLKYAGFGKNGDRNFAMSALSAYHSTEDILLMDETEYATSQAFLTTRIQPRILEDWYANNAFLLTDWASMSEKYRPPVSVAREWCRLHQEEKQLYETEEEPLAREIGVRRVLGAIRAYNHNLEVWKTKKASERHYIYLKKEGEVKDSRHRIRHKDVPSPEILKHNSFLPNRFATEIVVRSGELPGPKIDQALRAIALQIAEGTIPPDLTCDELLECVLDRGRSLDDWAFRQPKHEIIS